MSKLAKSLAVSSLAVGLAAFAGGGIVNAGSYDTDHGKDYWKPRHTAFGSYSDSNISFGEHYDRASKVFYSLVEDEKHSDSEHYSYNNNSYRDNDKDWGKHGKGWGGGYGNSVSINYNRDSSYSKSLEELKAATSKESYSSEYNQSSNRGNHGDWKKGGYENNSVTASVNLSKESSAVSAVKAEVASSSSVSTSVNLSNYGPHGGYNNSVSAYEDKDYYAKVEAMTAEHNKQSSSVNYSANNSSGNWGGHGGVNLASSSVDYSAKSSSESSKVVTYSAEEKASYSSGFESNTSSYNKPW